MDEARFLDTMERTIQVIGFKEDIAFQVREKKNELHVKKFIYL